MNWRHKIELNKVIADMTEKYDLSCFEEDCPSEVKTALASEVEKAFPLARFAYRLRNAKSIAAVNRLLAKIFNEADSQGVWCGL